MKAAGTNRRFTHSAVTEAQPKHVWAVWTDVENWGLWDTGLSAAEGAVDRLGATGFIADGSGRRSPFEVIEFEEGASYAFATRLPGGALVVQRVIESSAPTRFTHNVRFEGVGGAIMSLFLGKRFRRALPLTMQQVAERAEELAR